MAPSTIQDNASNTYFNQCASVQNIEVKLPPPTTFRRQNKKTGRIDIARSNAASDKEPTCAEKILSTKQTELNYEEWRRVFEQCCN